MKHHLHALMVHSTAVAIPIRQALVRMGFSVHVATTAAEAINRLNEQNFEFIFMEMDGHMNQGDTLLGRLHKEYWDIIPIAMCQRVTPHFASEIIEKGAYDCVAPTMTSAELKVVVLRALKRFESEVRAKEAIKKRVEQLSQFSRASDELMTEIESLKKEISLLQARKEMFHPPGSFRAYPE